jgi:catechol 2,3-dioxygenase-like lactoylglutathione lyase family enzyme
MSLEVVMLPVTDVDASVSFYRDKVGFVLDHDIAPGNGMRVVQLTPEGSSCSIVFGAGIGGLAAPGSVRNTHLVVDDIETVRDMLIGNGVSVGPVTDLGGIRYAYFDDPDANSWALQQIDSTVPPPNDADEGAPA